MFKNSRLIKSKIKDFIRHSEVIFYIVSDTDAKDYSICRYDLLSGNDKSHKFNTPLHGLILNGNKITVGEIGKRKRTFFSLNLVLLFSKNLSIKSIEKEKNKYLISISKEKKSVLAMYNVGNELIDWELDFYSGLTFFGSELLFCVKQVNKKNNHIYGIDKETGNTKWLHIINAEKKFQGVRFLSELNNVIYFFYTEDNKVYALDISNGGLIKSFQFTKQPVFYNNKIGCIGLFHEELNLETGEYKRIDMQSEYEKHFERTHNWIERENHIAHGLGFIGSMQNYDRMEDRSKDYVIYAIDLSTHRIVWQHTFKDTRPGWKKLEYDGKRIYLLKYSGILHIFEKNI